MRNLLSLALPAQDYIIAGSGPMLVRGWIDDPGDIDVVARGAAWQAALALGTPEPAPYSSGMRILLIDATVDIVDCWFPRRWCESHLFDSADTFHGIRFMSLDVVLQTKLLLRRQRDVEHAGILRANGVTTTPDPVPHPKGRGPALTTTGPGG